MVRFVIAALVLLPDTSPRDPDLNEPDSNFTFRKLPIHPGLVHEFEGWLSDGGPVTVAVDLSAAFDTNEYLNSVVRRDTAGRVTYEDDDLWFAYRWLGRLTTGVHVVQAWSGSATGTGVFTSLYFVRFEVDRSLEGRRILMRVVGFRSLGDRCSAHIGLDGSVVTAKVIPFSPADAAETIVIDTARR